MAYISITNTLSNGNVTDATQVNTNFTDIVNGTSDGTKDLNVSAGTFAGTLTANGNTVLGNASGDTITVTGTMTATPAVTCSGGAKVGGAETLKIWTYTATLDAGAIAAQTHTFTITAVTLLKVRALIACGYDNVTGEVISTTLTSNTLYTYAYLTNTTTCVLKFGTQYSANDEVSVTIIEAQ